MTDDATPNLNSKYAWREIDRASLPKRSAAERVADFLEIYGPFDEATARAQAARCIQCPEPLCVQGCPLSNRIPEWLALTAEGHFLEAAAILHSGTNLPEVCARMCPTDRLCEGMCILHGQAEPVSIAAIEQFLNEYAFAHGAMDNAVAPPNGLNVAVVGSGPCGLTCADELARRGYAVTVFDSKLLPGGLLVNGIAAFKLDKSVVSRRIENLKKKGVAFRLGITIGQDLALTELRSRFDAVFVGVGAQKARTLDIPGIHCHGVIQALPFIVQKNTDLPMELPPIAVQERRVVVIGGGDTAMDCLRTAIRCGARETICVYRRDEVSMPCGRQEYGHAVEEGVRFIHQAAPVAVLDDGNRQVRGLRLVRTELGDADEEGRRSFEHRAGTEFEIETDSVILALGFEPVSFPPDSDFSDLATNDRGTIIVDERYMTNLPGVFAGGSIVQGPSVVVKTVRDARRAAEQMDRYLRPSGETAKAGRT